MKVKKPTTNNEGPYRTPAREMQTRLRINWLKILMVLVVTVIALLFLWWFAWSWCCLMENRPSILAFFGIISSP